MKPKFDMEKLCRYAGYSYSTLKSHERYQDYVFARFIIMNYLYEQGLTTTQVGQYFKRDHATVTYAKKQVRDLLRNNSSVLFTAIWNKFQDNLIRDEGANEVFAPFIQIEEICTQL